MNVLTFGPWRFFQLHGKTYFRLEHYLPVSVLDKVEQSAIKERLPRMHSNYYGVPESDAQLEFLKVRLKTLVLCFTLVLVCLVQILK